MHWMATCSNWLETAASPGWMPAHLGVHAACGRRGSDGRPITVLDWRANRLVDKLASLVSARAPLAKPCSALLRSAKAAVLHAAAQLGAVTHAANHHVTWEEADGGA